MTAQDPWPPQATGVLLALPDLAGFTSPWRSTSYAPNQATLSIERRFPPHITVLAPFAEAADVAAMARLRAVAARHPPLDLRFRRVSQFGPGGAVWLVPEPHEPVLALLTDVVDAFPEHPPYGGLHPYPIPHLTVTTDGDDTTLTQVQAALDAQGGLTSSVSEVGVWQRGPDEVWQLVAAAPLGG
ncbi:MAG: 2'-5' RNA ligase family protein [Rhodoferax sp.]|nr:2'-5' RNA ligase family protein [Actinomycetota bacterium]